MLRVTFLGSHPLSGNWSSEISKPSNWVEADRERAVSMSHTLFSQVKVLDDDVFYGVIKGELVSNIPSATSNICNHQAFFGRVDGWME